MAIKSAALSFQFMKHRNSGLADLWFSSRSEVTRRLEVFMSDFVSKSREQSILHLWLMVPLEIT